MANYGFKVSPPGFDIKTATNQQLAFTSIAFGIKILIQGTVSVTATTGSATGTVAHGLAYAPAFICFPKVAGLNALQINETNLVDGESDTMFTEAWSDTTNLNVAITNNGTMVFKYYILVEDSE